MGKRRKTKLAIDVAMAMVLVGLMATAIVQDVPHEWLGVAMFVLVTAHVVLNRRWLAAVPRMRRDTLNLLQVFVLAALVVCVVGMMASSLVISRHAFGFLPALPGSSLARRVHMMCSYWMFILTFAHAGLHARFPKCTKPWCKWATRIACIVASCCGVASFVQLGLWGYLTGQVQFALVDSGTPFAFSVACYASVAALVTAVFHYVREGLAAAKRHGKAHER